MKTCSTCKIEKEFSEFHKNKCQKDSLDNQCKDCKKKRTKKYYQDTKERQSEYAKKYRKENKQKFKEQTKKYREANKEKIKEQSKKYYQANKERTKEREKKYRQANKEKRKEREKKYRQANKEKFKAYYKKWSKHKRKNDPLYKLKNNLRDRAYKAFKNKGYSKNTKTQEMLGVDWEVCKQHIERQFKKGMNWDNQGEWHIDHIIPLSSANNEKELRKLCHYSNLQPLWAEDNLIKSAKIEGQQVLLRI